MGLGFVANRMGMDFCSQLRILSDWMGGGDFFAPPKREQTEKTHREYPQTNQNSRGTLQATVAENRSVNAFGAPAQHRTTGELGDGEIERRI